MRKNNSPERRFGEEWRLGSGVPLALVPEIHRRVLINREPAMMVYDRIGVGPEVGRKITALLRKNRLPSTKRLILLSAGYPERTHEEIASAFGVTVEFVADVCRRAARVRQAEPLTSEYWEEIDADDLMPKDLAARAAAVRDTWRLNGVVEGRLSGSAIQGPPGGTSVGGRTPDRGTRGRSRQEAGAAQSQPAEGSLSNPRRRGPRTAGDKGQGPKVHMPRRLSLRHGAC